MSLAAENYLRAGAEGDLVEGRSLVVSVGGVEVLLCRTGGALFAVENRCSHQLSPLAGGKLRGCFIFCPLHGARFDLRDGKPIGQITDKYLRTFAVRAEGGEIYVNLDVQRRAGGPG
jgi:3-phenylpropionate/trans-cinnamate dioxygenase ferredoxin subunit